MQNLRDHLQVTTIDSVPPRTVAQPRSKWLSWAYIGPRLALGAIVALAAALRLSNLAALGYANHYYTAGVISMLQSWRNFFFVAAEPGGAVSIDKPPVGLWLQALSAYIFGINGVAMVLPEILCGLAAVVVLYHLVQRSFGKVAGLVAALALAVTPIVVATDRNNTIDSSLILVLLLAAWAFIKATESGRLSFLLLGTGLVGLGFNIKMLQAFLPLPAFYGLYILAAKVGWRRKVGYLALATVVLLVVSFSWATVVQLTPASQRPYVGSSGDNSVFNLIVGYNGVDRLLGMGGAGGGFAGPRVDGNRPGGNLPPPANGTLPKGNFQPPVPGNNNPGQNPTTPLPQNNNGRPAGPMGPGNFPNRARGGGPLNTGRAGPLRLFTTPLSKEMSWLLPFGLVTLVVLALREKLHWPLGTKHQAFVLWGGWLVTGGVFFSIASFFHEYYLSMLAPPLAALVGIGVMELWHLRERRPWPAFGVVLLAVGATLGLQYLTATAYIGWAAWLAAPLVLAGAGAIALGVSSLRRLHLPAQVGMGTLVAALLIIPTVWSVLTMLNSSNNQSLPSAYSGQASGPANRGNVQVNQALLNFLQANTQGAKYLMAVPSSMQGSDYIIATGRPVLYMGGFMGQDNVLTVQQLATLVSTGQLRYIYWSGQGGPGGMRNQSNISNWVTSQCTPVAGFETATQNFGAPDGTSGGGNGRDGMGNMQVSLYDCGK